MPTLLAAGRHDLADDEWRVLEPLLPDTALGGGLVQAQNAKAFAAQFDAARMPSALMIRARLNVWQPPVPWNSVCRLVSM